jgi:hypothetical protein
LSDESPIAARVAEGAKGTLKSAVDRYPELIKRNRLYYELQRLRATRNVRLRPGLTERPDLLRELDELGVVVVPDFLSPGEAQDMLDASTEVLSRAKRGEIPDHTFPGEQGILLRVAFADTLVPETRRFFDDDLIRGLFRAYLSPGVVSSRHEFDYRYGLSDIGFRQSDLFHFDNWRPICKAFLYLTDVSEANAPFVYMLGTHRPAKWRLRHEIDWETYGPTGPHGYLFPREVEALQARYAWEQRICTGAAGTLILADFRGLHRGTPMRAGQRVLLNNTFDLMNVELAIS